MSISEQIYTDSPSEFSMMKSQKQREPGKMICSQDLLSDLLGPPKRNKIYSNAKIHSQEMFSFLRKKFFPTFIDKRHLYKNAMMKFIVLYDKNIFKMRKRLFIHIYVLIALFVLK